MSAEQRYSLLVATLTSRAGVSLSASGKKGFSPTALCVNGNMFAVLSSKGQLVVKLPRERVDALVLEGHGGRFELAHGQAMTEWFAAGVELDESWLSLAEESLSFVEGAAAQLPTA